MKNLNSTTRFAFLMMMFVLLTTSIANAKGTATVLKTLQPGNSVMINSYITGHTFGITPTEYMKGASYQIISEKGILVYSGTIHSTKTFYVSARKLGKGIATLYVNGVVMRQFVIA
jgi:purine-nucleoside phosphorylase